MELLASAQCIARCIERGDKKLHPLKLRVFVDDITAFLMEKYKEVAEMAKKVMKKLKEEVEKKGPQNVGH